MKNKLIFRILGALASSLIIASVFVPFISVTGYSPSLWESYEITNALYLPIMIIVFGAIGVIFFALNIKTEFAYMSVGAIAFFAIMQTIDILDQGVFNTLSVGYYFLVIGAFVTGIMAFLTNLKTKNKIEVLQGIKKVEETSMLDQIDKLYNEQTTSESEISPIQPIDNVVQPLPIQPLEAITPVQPIEQVVEEKTIEEVPVVQEVTTQPSEVIEKSIVEQIQMEDKGQPINPVLQEFDVPKVEDVPVVEPQPVVEIPVSQPVNPVLQEFAQPVNPVLQEFGVPSAPVVEENTIVEQPANPVLQEFGINPTNTVAQEPIVQEQPVTNQEVEIVPLASINEPVNQTVQEFNNPGFIVTPQQNSNELDIFGQPINK